MNLRGIRFEEYKEPEDCFFEPELENYFVRLTSGGVVQADRKNGHWFGMWRWLRDEEVEEWTVL